MRWMPAEADPSSVVAARARVVFMMLESTMAIKRVRVNERLRDTEVGSLKSEA